MNYSVTIDFKRYLLLLFGICKQDIKGRIHAVQARNYRHGFFREDLALCGTVSCSWDIVNKTLLLDYMSSKAGQCISWWQYCQKKKKRKKKRKKKHKTN